MDTDMSHPAVPPNTRDPADIIRFSIAEIVVLQYQCANRFTDPASLERLKKIIDKCHDDAMAIDPGFFFEEFMTERAAFCAHHNYLAPGRPSDHSFKTLEDFHLCINRLIVEIVILKFHIVNAGLAPALVGSMIRIIHKLYLLAQRLAPEYSQVAFPGLQDAWLEHWMERASLHTWGRVEYGTLADGTPMAGNVVMTKRTEDEMRIEMKPKEELAWDLNDQFEKMVHAYAGIVGGRHGGNPETVVESGGQKELSRGKFQVHPSNDDTEMVDPSLGGSGSPDTVVESGGQKEPPRGDFQVHPSSNDTQMVESKDTQTVDTSPGGSVQGVDSPQADVEMDLC